MENFLACLSAAKTSRESRRAPPPYAVIAPFGFARDRDSVTLSDVELRALGLRAVVLALSEAHH
jgi:hypothetical protein